VNEKSLEGSGRGLVEALRDWGISRKTSLMITGVPFKIRTEYLLNW
jgi:hypothetical protein